MSVADRNQFVDIELLAIATPTFPRFMGINTSAAIWNGAELKRQYVTHQSAVERPPLLPYTVQFSIAVVFGLAFLISGVMGTASINNESSNLGLGSTWTWGAILVIALMGLGGGWFMGMLFAHRIRYKAAYGETIIVDRTRQREFGQVVVGHTYLKRLGFIARSSKRYFFGPTQTASVSDGMIVLEVSDPLCPVTEMRVGELYALPPGKGNLTGNAPADAYAYVQLVQMAGEMERKLKSKKAKDLIEEAGYVLIMAIAIIAIFLQATSGFQLDVTSLDVTEMVGAVQ